MRALGMDEAKIESIPHWQTADCYSPLERAVLAYTDCLVLDGGRTPDAVFDKLKEHLSDKEILQLTYITCMYDMHATMSRALRLEFDNRPEPVTEVAAPEGYGNRDISADLTGER
jgi:alkylhydroperoxidase family enzyme